jgi:hypothetical protein
LVTRAAQLSPHFPHVPYRLLVFRTGVGVTETGFHPDLFLT